MASKALEVSRWKAFAKGKQLRDAAYVDALEDWADAANEIPRLRLQALEELERKGEALLDAAKGSKSHEALEAWLEDAGEAIEVERRKVLAEQAADAAEDHDMDNDVRVLTSGVVMMLRDVRRGRPTHALIATLGKRCALRLARRPLLASARELLETWLGGSAGVRYLPASCTWDDGTLTFVVGSSPAGLARMLRRALLEQTGKRFKVRVQGRSDEDVDEVEESDDADDDGAASAPGSAADIDEDEAVLEQSSRLATLAPLLRAALQAGRPDARKLGALLVFAHRKLRQRQTRPARQALDVLAARLAAPPPVG